MKLEYVSSLALKIYSIKNKKRISWIDKINDINSLPLGKSLDEKQYRIIMQASNYYKHQTVFEEKFPSIDFLNSFINKIINKIKKNIDFTIFNNDIIQMHDEIDSVVNPLGLTGFE